MAFKLDDLIIDRIQYAVAESFDGEEMLYVLTQLSDATIDITAESQDATDARGTLIKRFWRAKSGTFTATNALLNLNVIGSASGEGKIYASDTAAITMPKIVKVAKTKDAAGVYQEATVTLTDWVKDSTVLVYELGTNGAMGKKYAKGDGSASDTEFSVNSTGVLTLPNDPEVGQYIVKYNRNVTSGAAIYNKADKFPGTVKLTLKALAVDPCRSDVLTAVYIVLPSFQVSPEISIGLSADGSNIDYSGDLQVAYCDENQTLYEIYMAEDDEEED